MSERSVIDLYFVTLTAVVHAPPTDPFLDLSNHSDRLAATAQCALNHSTVGLNVDQARHALCFYAAPTPSALTGTGTGVASNVRFSRRN